jgi:1,5-anhydro-D-fructose reductase (1,5-anhydro-D-mannitol-forming)
VFRIAILSFWHVHAKDYIREADCHSDAEIVACWDEVPERGRSEAERRDIPFHEDLDELLAREDVDGVIVTTPTVAHGKMIPAVAAAGKHVFAEKVIAPTKQQAEQVIAATEREGVTFVVSLPRLYAGYTKAIKQTINEGLLGDVTYLRVRVSHDGALLTEENPKGWLPERFFDAEAAAGGVTIDFGAHPLYLVRHLLGMAEEVNATYGRFTDRVVEDNAVVTMGFQTGAIGVAEASFVGVASRFAIEAHGTKGSLLYGPPDEQLRLRRTGGGQWQTLSLPPDDPTPFERWVELARRGQPDGENVRAALDLSALAEAANLSAASGRPVRPDDTRERG